MEHKEAIGREVKTLSNMIKRRIDNSSVFAQNEEITGMHGWIVGYLYRHRDQDIYQRDIEAEFSIRRSTATGMLQLMEKNDLITREAVDYDARLKKLVLTEKAIILHQEIIKVLNQLEEQLSEGLSKQEIDMFFAIIHRMKMNIE